MELGSKGDIVINMSKFVIAELGVIACAFPPTNEGEITETDMCDGLHASCAKVQVSPETR